jgi:hypothetical protein
MNLRDKIIIFLISLCILLTPSIQSSQINNEIKIQNPIIDINNTNNIKIIIYYLDNEGNFEKIIKILSKTNYQLFIDEISKLSNKITNFLEFINAKLEIMKKFQIISEEICINNIIDINRIQETDSNNLNLVDADSFVSHFSPLFIVGMGFGFGIGFRRMPVLQRIAGNLFSAGIIGLGGIVCLDIEDRSIFYQYTFTYPYLIHILSGFIGIMMFAFDNIFPPENGPPISIYSNFLAIGMAGLAIGVKVPRGY